jgi:DNA-binding transcriptional regulator YdaS (Cro superfamily)
MWTEHTSLAPLVEVEALSDTLKIENPNLRQEVMYTYVTRVKKSLKISESVNQRTDHTMAKIPKR